MGRGERAFRGRRRGRGRAQLVGGLSGDRTKGTRIAVVGADGFIGSAVVRAALRANIEVTAVSIKVPWRLDDLRTPHLTHLSAGPGRWLHPARTAALPRAPRAADVVA